MSAYQVSDETIILVAVNAVNISDPEDLELLNRAARCLWDANAESLRARYDGMRSEGKAPKVTLDDVEKYSDTDAVTVIKCADCLAYQSCEFDGWDTSEALRLVRRARSNAWHRLPGYDDAPWGLEG